MMRGRGRGLGRQKGRGGEEKMGWQRGGVGKGRWEGRGGGVIGRKRGRGGDRRRMGRGLLSCLIVKRLPYNGRFTAAMFVVQILFRCIKVVDQTNRWNGA